MLRITLTHGAYLVKLDNGRIELRHKNGKVENVGPCDDVYEYWLSLFENAEWAKEWKD